MMKEISLSLQYGKLQAILLFSIIIAVIVVHRSPVVEEEDNLIVQASAAGGECQPNQSRLPTSGACISCRRHRREGVLQHFNRRPEKCRK